MDSDRIRTRAYFHYVNRTGKQWNDPVENWMQAEQEERAFLSPAVLDITQELLTYRPLSQFFPLHVLPAIAARVANGTLSETALPLEAQKLQILWPQTGAPIVRFNDEVQIQIRGQATRNLELGDPVYLSDLVPETVYLDPPTVDGKPAAYYMFSSSFMDLSVYFDFTANWSRDQPSTPAYPRYRLHELAMRAELIRQHPPRALLEELKGLGWPPSPTYYPILVETLAMPGGASPTEIASTISRLHGPDYWKKRIALWKELGTFGSRMPYISKSIEEYLEGDYASSIYVAVPQFEGTISDYVRIAGCSVSSRFREVLVTFKNLLESRKVLLFPRFMLEIVVGYFDAGSFWNQTTTILDPKQEVNRHGIAHGVFTGFETQELALKFLLLLDCLAFMLLQDRIICGTL